MSFLKHNSGTRLGIAIIALVLFLAATISVQLFKNASEKKSPIPIEKTATSSIKLKVNDPITPPTQEPKQTSGTCTVTKNGVTTIVPSDQVNINENSSADVNVKVDCKSTSSNSSSSYSNSSSVNTNINIQSNTSN